MGLVAELADFAEHGEFVFAGGFGFQDDDHGDEGGFLRRPKQNSRRRETCGGSGSVMV
jgi:hypothetical protein